MKVLVVEDNKMAQKIAQMTLVKLGCNVDIANDGIEAVEQFEKNTYDFIFMDLGLPKMDGYTATEKMRALEQSTHTPIAALTANISESCQEKARGAGMDDFLAKPLTLETAKTMFAKYVSKTA